MQMVVKQYRFSSGPFGLDDVLTPYFFSAFSSNISAATSIIIIALMGVLYI